MTAPAKIVCILGPTASGKSALALAMARERDGSILSVDSMQVYRGMNIGTAKPTEQEQIIVQHAGLDLVPPTETFSVAKFVSVADGAIAASAKDGRVLFAAGGSPLYFKAVFDGLFEGPTADPEKRVELFDEPPAVMHARLVAVDPAAAARLHPNDTRRVRRALDVYTATGQTISSLQTEWASGQSRHDAVWIGLRWDTEALNRRINARAKEMMRHGWLEETEHLLKSYGELSSTASMAAGYALLSEVIRGRRTVDDALEQIKIRTRQLARRQMKWFRRFPRVHWLDGSLDFDVLFRQAAAIIAM